jgi:large subunit ribosomal protein L18
MKAKETMKQDKRKRRHARVRSKIFGTPARPRLSVYKSNQSVYAQLIDDASGVTVLSCMSKVTDKKGTRVERAYAIGKAVAEQGVAKGINKVVFDRGGFVYTGVIKAVAEGARAGGLKV